MERWPDDPSDEPRGSLTAPLEPGEDEDPGETKMIDTAALGSLPKEIPPAVAHLVCVAGNDTGRVFPLQGATTLIGRGLTCAVVLNDPSVSRQHFNVLQTPQGHKLIDLGSGNGTRVGGARVQEVMLEEGAEIEVGITTLQFTRGDPPRGDRISVPPTPAPAPAPPAPVVPQQPRAGSDVYASGAGPLSRHPGNALSSADGMKVVAPPFEEPFIPDDDAGGGAGGLAKLAAIGLVGLLVLAGLFLAADAIFGLGVVFGGDEGGSAEVADDGDPDALLEEAESLLGEQRWEDAVTRLEAVRRLDPERPELRRLLRRARDERDAQNDWNGALEKLESGDKTNAIKLLVNIPDNSSYYEDAQAKLEEVRGLRGAGATATGAVSGGGGAAPAGSAVALFDAGRFDEAAAAFRQEAAAAADPAARANAESRAQAVTAFAAAQAAAQQALASGDTTKALDQLDRAIALNLAVGGHSGEKLRAQATPALLARAEARLAKSEAEAGVKDLLQVIRDAPQDPAVKAARSRFASHGDTVHQAARKALMEMRNDDAKLLFEALLWLLPEGDSRRFEAEGMLKGLSGQAGGGDQP